VTIAINMKPNRNMKIELLIETDKASRMTHLSGEFIDELKHLRMNEQIFLDFLFHRQDFSIVGIQRKQFGKVLQRDRQLASFSENVLTMNIGLNLRDEGRILDKNTFKILRPVFQMDRNLLRLQHMRKVSSMLFVEEIEIELIVELKTALLSDLLCSLQVGINSLQELVHILPNIIRTFMDRARVPSHALSDNERYNLDDHRHRLFDLEYSDDFLGDHYDILVAHCNLDQELREVHPLGVIAFVVGEDC